MALNRFIINRDIGLESKVRGIVENTYPDVMHPDRRSINHPVSSSGGESLLYEGVNEGRKEKIVWGVTRMGSKRVVTK